MIDEALFKIEVIYDGTGTTHPPGGQYAGSPSNSVRVTHIPSGIVAQCGAARSQHKNRQICFEMIEGALTSKYANELL